MSVRRLSPEVVFIVLSTLFGLLFTFITPPFRVPDEPTHFFRAFAIAQGGFVPEVDAGRVGDELPTSVVESANAFIRGIANETEEFDRPLRPLARHFESIGGAYSPVPYIPQVFGIGIMATAGAAPVEILSAARVANLLLTTLLIAVAIAVAPILKPQIAFVALLPMTMYLRASASADAMATALAFLTLGLALRIAFGEAEKVPRGFIFAFLVLAFLLPLTKPVYAPIALVAGVSRRRRATIILCTLLMASLGVAAGTIWNSAVIGPADPRTGAHPAAQVDQILADPVRAIGVTVSELVLRAPRYAAHLIGTLGWLDLPLPLPLLAAYACAIGALLLTSAAEVRWWQRLITSLLLASTLLGVGLALYVGHTPVGANYIAGIQGRYFTPVVPLLFLITANRRFAHVEARAWYPAVFAAFCAIGLALTLWVIVDRYYL